MKLKYSLIPLLLLILELLFSFTVYSQDAPQDTDAGQPEQNETLKDDKRRPVVAGAIAVAETLFSDAVLWGLNRYVFQFEWARTTAESVNRNLSEGWFWEDTDGFKVNNFGHPYQGSYYFAAGRSNGFNFYESIAFNVLGSAAWEYFAERKQKSTNDLIATTVGGASLGEMLHRLYIAARVADVPVPLAVLISPIDGLTALITSRGGGGYNITVRYTRSRFTPEAFLRI